MPPKAKFDKGEVINTALEIIDKQGIEYVTARNLGKFMGSSARPIFTLFESMDELMDAVNEKANEIYGQYVERGLKEDKPFRGVGRSYILFASEHPKLFQLLFMQELKDCNSKNTVLKGIENHYEDILQSIESEYNMTRDTAYDLYFHMWVYTHGIAVMIATKLCIFTPEQINKMMSEMCLSLIKTIKTEGKL